MVSSAAQAAALAATRAISKPDTQVRSQPITPVSSQQLLSQQIPQSPSQIQLQNVQGYKQQLQQHQRQQYLQSVAQSQSQSQSRLLPEPTPQHLPNTIIPHTNRPSADASPQYQQHVPNLQVPHSRRTSVYSVQSYSTPSLFRSSESLPQHTPVAQSAPAPGPTPTPHVFRKTLRSGSSGNSSKPKSKFQNLKSGSNKKKTSITNYINAEDRKRYQGIYASNKGVYTNNPDRISRIIVEELWGRSKLDYETLRKIWDLVIATRRESTTPNNSSETDDDMDTSYVNLENQLMNESISGFCDDNNLDDGLTCDEFVVGIWLIDQCLQGRKLPKSVPDTVWDTLGIEVKNRKAKKKVFGVI